MEQGRAHFGCGLQVQATVEDWGRSSRAPCILDVELEDAKRQGVGPVVGEIGQRLKANR